ASGSGRVAGWSPSPATTRERAPGRSGWRYRASLRARSPSGRRASPCRETASSTSCRRRRRATSRSSCGPLRWMDPLPRARWTTASTATSSPRTPDRSSGRRAARAGRGAARCFALQPTDRLLGSSWPRTSRDSSCRRTRGGSWWSSGIGAERGRWIWRWSMRARRVRQTERRSPSPWRWIPAPGSSMRAAGASRTRRWAERPRRACTCSTFREVDRGARWGRMPAVDPPELTEFAEHLARIARASPHTRRAYLSDLRQLAAWLAESGKSLDGADRDDLRAFLASRFGANQPATLARKQASLRAYYEHRVRMGHLTDSPARRLASPRRRRTLPNVVSVDDLF